MKEALRHQSYYCRASSAHDFVSILKGSGESTYVYMGLVKIISPVAGHGAPQILVVKILIDTATVMGLSPLLSYVALLGCISPVFFCFITGASIPWLFGPQLTSHSPLTCGRRNQPGLSTWLPSELHRQFGIVNVAWWPNS